MSVERSLRRKSLLLLIMLLLLYEETLKISLALNSESQAGDAEELLFLISMSFRCSPFVPPPFLVTCLLHAPFLYILHCSESFLHTVLILSIFSPPFIVLSLFCSLLCIIYVIFLK